MTRITRLSAAAALIVGAFAAGYLGTELSRRKAFADAADLVAQAEEKLRTAEDLQSKFRLAAAVIEPSVVQIEVRRTTPAPQRRLPFDLDSDMLRRFFDLDGDGIPDIPDGLGQRESAGTGSGVIMAVEGRSGYILTNNHVAGGADQITVHLHDGRKITGAALVGADPRTDLAVVKIEADGLLAAKWGDSDQLRKGDIVLAFGSPFGYIGSMTQGIVSALNRQAGLLGAQGYENFIQVDAAINPGNSGGPLANLSARVIGINVAIATRNGGFQGIGFAIPSNQARFVFDAIRQRGKVVRGWLGVSISSVADDPRKARTFGFEGAEGVLVEQVLPDTPAVGVLKPGDIITALNATPVRDVQDLRGRIARLAPETEVKLDIFRDGKKTQATIRLGEQPDDMDRIAGRPENAAPGRTDELLGMQLRDITRELASRFAIPPETRGALVVAVAPGSPAAEAGIRPGDVITRVGAEDVTSTADLAQLLKGRDKKRDLRLYVLTGNAGRFVVIPGEGN